MSRAAAISIRVRPSTASAITCGALARACGGCPLYLPSAFAGDPLALALEHDLVLELGHCRHDGQDHAAHRASHAAVGMARRFDRHYRVEDLERYAARAELPAIASVSRTERAKRPRRVRTSISPAQQVESGPLADT